MKNERGKLVHTHKIIYYSADMPKDSKDFLEKVLEIAREDATKELREVKIENRKYNAAVRAGGWKNFAKEKKDEAEVDTEVEETKGEIPHGHQMKKKKSPSDESEATRATRRSDASENELSENDDVEESKKGKKGKGKKGKSKKGKGKKGKGKGKKGKGETEWKVKEVEA